MEGYTGTWKLDGGILGGKGERKRSVKLPYTCNNHTTTKSCDHHNKEFSEQMCKTSASVTVKCHGSSTYQRSPDSEKTHKHLENRIVLNAW